MVTVNQNEPASCSMGTVTLPVLGRAVRASDAIAHKAIEHDFVRKRAANMEAAQLACHGALGRHMMPEDGGNDQAL